MGQVKEGRLAGGKGTQRMKAGAPGEKKGYVQNAEVRETVLPKKLNMEGCPRGRDGKWYQLRLQRGAGLYKAGEGIETSSCGPAIR